MTVQCETTDNKMSLLLLWLKNIFFQETVALLEILKGFLTRTILLQY